VKVFLFQEKGIVHALIFPRHLYCTIRPNSVLPLFSVLRFNSPVEWRTFREGFTALQSTIQGAKFGAIMLTATLTPQNVDFVKRELLSSNAKCNFVSVSYSVRRQFVVWYNYHLVYASVFAFFVLDAVSNLSPHHPPCWNSNESGAVGTQAPA
jgi:hypothetical protein